jgi:hypothetical protein
MHSKPIIYAILCVVVPVAWGLGVYLISNVIERRVRRGSRPHSDKTGADNAETLSPEYYI